MRHSNSGRKFSRTPSHRKAMLQNLAKSLLLHTKVQTTEHKAKDLRGVVERLITLAKRNDLHARRQAYRVLGNHNLVQHLFDSVGPSFAGIPGGYTRVIKLVRPRAGDGASMAIIRLTKDPIPVDYSEKPKRQAAPTATVSTAAEEPETLAFPTGDAESGSKELHFPESPSDDEEGTTSGEEKPEDKA
ncbi:MAG: 50S ribosomal protein L17 [Desulfovibrio sp.]|jgi:large subunit ribosomal protein L17|nr:50S ribosomal protein L17 [Desulfovibrio sp.]